MILRPERKIVVNGLPRTIKNRETRPLIAFGRKEKKNTIKNKRKKENEDDRCGGENHKEKSEKQGYDEKEFSFLMKQA
jgi:hypothetical protein